MISPSLPSSELDPLAPDFRRLNDLIATLPHRPSAATKCRWTRRGIRGVKLPVLKIAGHLCTTERAFKRFLAAIQDAPSERTEEEHAATERLLKARGLL